MIVIKESWRSSCSSSSMINTNVNELLEYRLMENGFIIIDDVWCMLYIYIKCLFRERERERWFMNFFYKTDKKILMDENSQQNLDSFSHFWVGIFEFSTEVYDQEYGSCCYLLLLLLFFIVVISYTYISVVRFENRYDLVGSELIK